MACQAAGSFAVNDHLQAVGVTGDWLYALGDTTGRARLSHISTYHGHIVADIIAARAAGRELGENELAARDAGSLAQVIFTEPQVASAGLTESQARAEGFVVRTRTAHYPGTLSFLALFRDGFQGWAKLVINAETNTLLGATFVGPEFSELVQAATLAIVAKVPVEPPTPCRRAPSDGQSGLGSAGRPRVRTCPLRKRAQKHRRAHKRIALFIKPVRPRS